MQVVRNEQRSHFTHFRVTVLHFLCDREQNSVVADDLLTVYVKLVHMKSIKTG